MTDPKDANHRWIHRAGLILLGLALSMGFLGFWASRPGAGKGASDRASLPLRLHVYQTPDGKGGFKQAPRILDAKPGLKTTLDPAGLALEVLQVLPRARRLAGVRDNPAVGDQPLLQVLLGLGTPEPLTGTLFARDPQGWFREEPQGRFAVAFRERLDEAVLKDLLPRPPQSQRLELGIAGQTLSHPVRVGEPWELPGFSLTVVEVFPDFGGVRQGPGSQARPFSRSSKYRNPWALVRLRQATGETGLMLLSARPIQDRDYQAHLARTLPPGASLAYLCEGGVTASRVALYTREDAKVRLVEGGRVVRTEEVVLNRPFVVARGLSVTAVARLDHADLEPTFEPETVADAAAPAAVQVKISDGNAGPAEIHWLEARETSGDPAAITFLGGRVGLLCRHGEPEAGPVLGSRLMVAALSCGALGGLLLLGAGILRARRFW